MPPPVEQQGRMMHVRGSGVVFGPKAPRAHVLRVTWPWLLTRVLPVSRAVRRVKVLRQPCERKRNTMEG